MYVQKETKPRKYGSASDMHVRMDNNEIRISKELSSKGNFKFTKVSSFRIPIGNSLSTCNFYLFLTSISLSSSNITSNVGNCNLCY